jgi:hypothetical protein
MPHILQHVVNALSRVVTPLKTGGPEKMKEDWIPASRHR